MNKFALLPLCLCLTSAWAADEKTLKEVTVTGASSSDVAERQQASTQKIIIGKDEIEKMGALTIGDVLGKLPGVDASTTGSTGTMAVRSRGMVRDSVQMMIDGEKVHGNVSGVQSIVGRLSSSELKQVEISRGSSAEVGGSSALTVNLVLNKPLAKDSTAIKVVAGFRDNRPVLQTTFTKGGGDKAFSWLVPININHQDVPIERWVNRRDSTGVWQDDHDQGINVANSASVSPRMTWKSGMNSFTLQPMLFHSTGRAENTAQRMDSTVPANSSTRLDSDASRSDFARMRADTEVYSKGIKYTSRVAVSGFDRSTDTWRNGLTTGGLSTSSVERVQSLTRDQNAAFRMDGSSGLHVLAGNIEVMAHQRDESQRNSSLGINETHTAWDQQWTSWVQDEWSPSKALTLTTGLRSEAIRYAVDGAEQSHQRLLPSVALRWEPAAQWMLRTSLGAGIKPPQLAELTNQPVLSVSANTPLEPDRRGNPALRPERSVNFELALERYLPNEAGVLGANIYLRHTDDFTERRVLLEGTRWVDRPYNEGFARHWGLELDGKLRTDNFGWRGATFRTHLTLPRSAVNDERLGLTRDAREQPRYILSAGFDQTQATMSYGVSMQYSGAVQTQVAGEQAFETQSRAVFDVYTLHKINNQFNLRLSVQNLFAADTQRQMSAFAPPAMWSLGSTDKGVRVALVSLEGKW